MTRIPRLRPANLDDPQLALYDAIAGGKRASTAHTLTDAEGALEGPFNAMLLHPPLGEALQQLGTAIRFSGTLSARARELATLTVAEHARSRFEQQAHERLGRAAGLTEADIEAIRNGAAPDVKDPEEAAIVRATRLLLASRDLTDAEYAETTAALSPAKLFELTTLVGYYQLLALQMRVFAVD
jgi:4-carboxymuconolactone decarboxylase